jgi:hypothetical protein
VSAVRSSKGVGKPLSFLERKINNLRYRMIIKHGLLFSKKMRRKREAKANKKLRKILKRLK